MLSSQSRRWLGMLRRTPLHPQWLLGRKLIPQNLANVTGALLDIGAGDRWIEPSLPEAVSYVSLDYPTTGRDLYGAQPHVFADAARLPFSSETFEGVVCLEVLEHVPDPALVISEIARVLKLGGRAWISMPFLYPLHDEPFDYQRYTEFGLRRDIARAGLEVVLLRRSGHAIQTAGLLMCLAIAGGVHAQRGLIAVALMPAALIGVVAINLASWILSQLWPDWCHMALGFEIELRKA